MEDLFKQISQEKITQYQAHLEKLELSEATIKRRLSALRKFYNWAEKEGYLEKPPRKAPVIKETPSIKRLKYLTSKLRPTFPSMPTIPFISDAYEVYQSISITKYLHYAILIIFCVALGIGIYNQLTGPKAEPAAGAYPTDLTRPKRYLSFQGRLTDSSNNPISIITNFVFELYDDPDSGAQLWTSGDCSIDPDEDGIFSVLLGLDCGSEIDDSVFSGNDQVWLQITVGTGGLAQTLSPRIQVATVAYALNAETLQGYPPGTATSTIPYIDSTGKITIAAASPILQATSASAAFVIEGKTGLVLQTASASNANINIAPNGTGALNINLGGISGNQMQVTDANITSGSLVSVYAGTSATGFDLLNLSSGPGTPGTTVFSVDESGNTYAAGNLGIGITTPGAKLDVVGDIKIGTVNSVDDNYQVLTTDSGIVKYIDTSNWDKNSGDDYGAWLLAGDSGTPQSIGAGDTASFVGGIGIGTTASATDTLTISVDQSYGFAWTGAQSWSNTATFNGTLDANSTVTLGDNGENVTIDSSVWDISGAGAGSGFTQFTVDNIDLNGNTIAATDNGGLYLYDNASNGIFIEDGGNVGIGTTGPSGKLQVTGDEVRIGSGGTLNYADSDGDLYVQYDLEVDGTIYGAGGSLVSGTGTPNKIPKWSTSSSLTDSVMYDDGTNVGIGTTDPSEKLHVAGDVALSGALSAGDSTPDNHAWHVFGTGEKDEAAIADAEDVYVSGDLEVDGTIYGAVTGSISFANITSGTNTQAAMVVGTGASLTYHDGAATSGEINASLLQNANWAAPLAIGGTTPAAGNFTSIGVTTQGTGAFTTLTSSGNSTIGTGASSINTIGSTTTPGTLTLHGATTLDNTFTVSGNYLTSLGGNLTVTGTAWTAIPTISGVVTMTSGFDSDAASTVTSLTIDGAAGAGDLTINSGETSFTSPATTADANAIVANSLTSGGALDISSTATNFSGSLIDVTLSGSNANNSGSLLTLTNSGTLNTGTTLYVKHYATGTNNLAMRVDDVSGDTTPFVIDGGGNVGIGTTAPGSKLHLVGGDVYVAPDSGYTFDNPSVNEDVYVYGNLEVDGTIYGAGGSLVSGTGTPNKIPKWNTSSSLTDSVMYDDGTNVGIGTTDPGAKLELANYALANGPNIVLNSGMYDGSDYLAGLLYNVNAGSGAGTTISAIKVKEHTANNYGLEFQTYDAGTQLGTRMTILGNGNVGIGTTGPGDKLDVVGEIDTSTYYKLGNSKILDADSDDNLLIGQNTGPSLVAGAIENTFVGQYAGYTTNNSLADRNVFLGAYSGYLNTSGYQNTFLGYSAGYTNDSGYYNTFIGVEAGISNTSGRDNVFIGHSAGYANTTGIANTYIGNNADGQSGTNYSIVLSSGAGAQATADHQLVVGGAYTDAYVTDSYWGSGVTDATPYDFTLNATGGSGTNIAGANLKIAGGKATGNAAGGSIIFLTSDAGASGTTLQSLSEKMRITAGGNVGIGDTTPVATLTVGNGDLFQVAGATGNITTAGDLAVNGGDITTTATTLNIDVASPALLRFREGTTTLAQIAGSGSSTELFSVQGSRSADQLYIGIDSYIAQTAAITGNDVVGIRSYPRYQGTTGTQPNLYGIVSIPTNTSTGAVTTMYGLYARTDSSSGAVTNAYGIYIDDPTGASSQIANLYGLKIDNLTEGTSKNWSIYSEGGTMYHAGNVGIGTTGPSTLLEVAGPAATNTSVTLSGTTTAYARFIATNTSAGGQFGIEGSVGGSIASGTTAYATYLGDFGNKPLQLGTNNTVRMTIDNTGNVGIGTTNPGYKLEVAGTAQFDNAVYFANGTTYYIDASGNAKFLDLIAADTGNPGLTVGDGTTGYIKVGGSTISDAAGNLTLDSDSGTVYTPDNLTVGVDLRINGNDILDAGGLTAITFDGSQNTALAGNLDVSGDINFTSRLLEDGNEILSGMIAAFTTACPTGWTEYTAARGRVVVGTPLSGTNEGTVGTALTNLANRTINTVASHTHSFTPAGTVSQPTFTGSGGTTGSTTPTHGVNDPGHSHSYDTRSISEAVQSGSGAPNHWRAVTYVSTDPATTGISITGGAHTHTFTPAGTVSQPTFTGSGGTTGSTGSASVDVTMPYIQLTYCKKNAGSDLAEWIQTEEDISKATIVSIDPNNNEKIIVSKKEYDPTVVGIIATQPGWLIGDEKPDAVQMALAGRVPTTVSLKNGFIERGDPITTSTIPGVGMLATREGPIVGKAMEPLDETSYLKSCLDEATGKEEKCGYIYVFVNISWYNPQTDENDYDGQIAKGEYVDEEIVIQDDVEEGDVVSLSYDYAPQAASDSEFIRKAYLRKASGSPDNNVVGVIGTGTKGELIERIRVNHQIVSEARLITNDRTLVKIDPASEPIKAGDFLASSEKSGLATKATRTGFIIGRALESWIPDSNKEKIMIFVSPSWYEPKVYLTDIGELSIKEAEGTEKQSYQLTDAAGKVIEGVGAFAKVAVAEVKAGLIQVEKLLEAKEIKTNLISPLLGTDLTINLERPDESGKLVINGKNEEGVVIIDSEGNATFQGELAANKLQVFDAKITLLDAFRIKASELNVDNTLNVARLLISQAIQASQAVVDEIFSERIYSRKVETEELATNLILPLTGENVTIKLSNLPDQQESKFGKLLIQNGQGKTVASIDSEGNATFSGTVETEELHAKKIVAEEIVGLKGKFGELISATVSAEKIQGLEKRLAQLEASSSPSPTPTPPVGPPEEEANPMADTELSPDIEALVNEILGTSLEATPQAQLADIYLADIYGDNLDIINNLSVLGATSLADTSIAGSLNVGGTMTLADNSINTLTGPLYLQNLGLGGIDILAGKITIDEQGNAVFEGNVTIKGRLALSEIEPLPGQEDVVIDLTPEEENQPETESRFGKLLVKGVDDEIVASIEASGTATFKKLAIAKAEEKVAQISETEIETNATAGQAILAAGETEITIKSQFVTDKTMVYVTPTSNTQNKVLFVKAKKGASEGEIGWFKVGIDTSIKTDIKFNWWIIN